MTKSKKSKQAYCQLCGCLYRNHADEGGRCLVCSCRKYVFQREARDA